MTVIFHPEALSEMADAAKFYEKRVPGLGEDLLVEIQSALARILQEPLRSMKFKGDVRRHMINRFPYNLLYSVEPTHIYIVAVMHQSRHPDYWSHRLTS